MTKNKKRLMSVALVVVAVMGAIAIRASWVRAAVTPRLPVSFVSFTNPVAGGVTAVFSITNPYPRPVNFFAALPQERAVSGWPENVSMPPSPMGFELGGNQVTNFSVSIPTNGSWRVPVLVVFVPTRFDHWRELVKLNWNVYRETGALPGLNTGYGLSGGWTNFTEEFKFSDHP